MMISKRNDEGHKSKTLIWTQWEQKPRTDIVLYYSYKICMWYVYLAYILQRLLDRIFYTNSVGSINMARPRLENFQS